MNGIILAVVSVSVIGLLCAVMLTVASKIMAVKVDERFPKVRGELPGANCGACGFAGCDAYAQALIDNPELKANLCVPGGSATAKNLALALGKEFEAVEEKVAVVRCSGTNDKTADKVEYQGYQTCKASKLFYSGKGACSYSCIGLGDCLTACKYGAITVAKGKATIDPDLCVGCGACASVCPSKVIEIVPKKAKVFVGCSSCDKGINVRKACSIGCIGCHKCEKECPVGAITVNNNIATIDYSKCISCGKCADVCIAKCIHKR